MRTLVIDSATEGCSVALFEQDELVAGAFEMLGRGHAERLVPMIAALPGRGRAGRIAVSLGPGSFTGLRVGLAAARALALAWQAEIVGYPTFALIAAMALAERGAQPLAVATTGGHGEWFVERFSADGRSIAPLASLKPDQAATTVREPLIAGSQAEALVAQRGSGQALPLWTDARRFALLPPETLTADLQPLYGRAPDARLPGGHLPGAPLPETSPAASSPDQQARQRRMIDDIDRIMAVMTAAFDPLYGEAWNRRQVEDALVVGSCHYLLAWPGDTAPHDRPDGAPARGDPGGEMPAGFCLSRTGYEEEELLLFAVAPQHRGQGIGLAMLERFAAEARGRGARRLLLEMRRGNPAERLYVRFGFVPIGVRPNYYRTSDGSRIDAITFANNNS